MLLVGLTDKLNVDRGPMNGDVLVSQRSEAVGAVLSSILFVADPQMSHIQQRDYRRQHALFAANPLSGPDHDALVHESAVKLHRSQSSCRTWRRRVLRATERGIDIASDHEHLGRWPGYDCWLGTRSTHRSRQAECQGSRFLTIALGRKVTNRQASHSGSRLSP